MTYFADRTFVLTYSQNNDIEKLEDVLNKVTIIDNKGNKSHNWFKDNKGITPLHAAVSKGNKECVSLLMKYNAAQIVNEKEIITGKTCLHNAAAKGYSEIMKMVYLILIIYKSYIKIL